MPATRKDNIIKMRTRKVTPVPGDYSITSWPTTYRQPLVGLEKDEGNDLRIPCLSYRLGHEPLQGLPLPQRGGRGCRVLVTPGPPGRQP